MMKGIKYSMDLQKLFDLARLEPFQFDTTYLVKMGELFNSIPSKTYQGSASTAPFEINTILPENEPVQYTPTGHMIGDYFRSNKAIGS